VFRAGWVRCDQRIDGATYVRATVQLLWSVAVVTTTKHRCCLLADFYVIRCQFISISAVMIISLWWYTVLNLFWTIAICCTLQTISFRRFKTICKKHRLEFLNTGVSVYISLM
jgi:hypothetical protein